MKPNLPLVHWPLQELRRPISWLLLFVLPAIASSVALLSSRPAIYQIVLPYVLFVGGLGGLLEVRGSKKIQMGGVGSIAPTVFRNVCHTGFLVALGAIGGFLAGWGLLLIR